MRLYLSTYSNNNQSLKSILISWIVKTNTANIYILELFHCIFSRDVSVFCGFVHFNPRKPCKTTLFICFNWFWNNRDESIIAIIVN